MGFALAPVVPVEWRPPNCEEIAVPSGIKIKDLALGEGAVAQRDCIVTIRYDGFLNHGEPFQTGEVVTFRLGSRRVIAGLELGVEGMHVGARRRIRVRPHLAYRAAGVPGVIPTNAVLTFEIELLAVEQPQASQP